MVERSTRADRIIMPSPTYQQSSGTHDMGNHWQKGSQNIPQNRFLLTRISFARRNLCVGIPNRTNPEAWRIRDLGLTGPGDGGFWLKPHPSPGKVHRTFTGSMRWETSNIRTPFGLWIWFLVLLTRWIWTIIRSIIEYYYIEHDRSWADT